VSDAFVISTATDKGDSIFRVKARGEQAMDGLQSRKRWTHLFVQSKQYIGRVTSRYFWTRYLALAVWLPLRAFLAVVTGRTGAGSTHASINLDESLKYVTRVFDDYRILAGVDRFHGKIAEIGSGDSCGVALMFLAHGCEHIDLVDRFFSPRDNSRQQEINRIIVSQHPELGSRCINDVYSESSFRGLERYYGENAAAETFFRNHNGYAAIVSRAVFEHLYDPLAAIAFSAKALVSGGTMVHFVDCRDHGLFSTQFHELKFLELSAFLYSPLKWRGGPNRIRLSSYIQALKQAPVEYSIYIRHLAGLSVELPERTTFDQIEKSLLAESHSYVNSVRRQLARPFSQMDDQDLMVQGFAIYAQRTI
jgi:hypothetical protein